MPLQKKSIKANNALGLNLLLNRVTLRLADIILAILILLGFGLRMVDLTDPPLDFHPTRQIRGARIARSIFYQLSPSPDPFIQRQALLMRDEGDDLEPPILESVVAFGYLLAGGEYLWISRIITSLVWVLAAIPLFALARRFTSPGAGLLAVSYYLFLPFGVVASRSFQPDPPMVALLVLGMYATYRWSETRTWYWSVWTAATMGFAILAKALAAYFASGILLAVVLYTLGYRAALRDKKVWAMAAITVLPAVVYYLLMIGPSSANVFQKRIVALLPLALEPGFYVRWANILTGLLGGLAALITAFCGVFIAKFRARWLLIGAWAGYALYGITIAIKTTSHNYYHLFLVPLVALSIAPVLQLIARKISLQTRFTQGLFVLVLLAALFFTAWTTRSDMLGVSYRNEPLFWQRIGAAIPVEGKTIGLVQAYGNMLTYYGWRQVDSWPATADLYVQGLRGRKIEDFETFFTERTAGMDYFLVTSFNQLNQQPQLADYLEAHYPVYSRGDGFIIYDLRKPIANN